MQNSALKKLEISESNMTLWSRLGTRAVYGAAIQELASCNEDLMVLTADTSTSAGLDRFRKSYPEKYIDVGISEQNLIGIASGLASEGWVVIASTFSPFITMRCLEQIKVMVAYNRSSVKFVGLASGVVLGDLGYTHCSIEDISVIRSIPGIIIISPADCTELVKALPQILTSENPVYLRLTGSSPMPRVYLEDYEFKIGEPVILRKGGNIAILAIGSMVSTALEVGKILESYGVETTIINVHTIMPCNITWVDKYLRDFALIATIEEHSISGGLGTAVLEALNEVGIMTQLIKFGLPHLYGQSGNYEFMLTSAKLNPVEICEVLKAKILHKEEF